MKKMLLIAVMAISGVAYVAAQPRAIGANLGTSLGFSYQHGFGASNMLDVAANVPFISTNGVGFGIGGHVTYDWIDPFNAPIPWNQRGEWHWAMGVGGAGGVYGFKEPVYWFAGVAGHIGVAYDFWFPMELSIDWRPCIGVDNVADKIAFGTDGLMNNCTIGIRYLF